MTTTVLSGSPPPRVSSTSLPVRSDLAPGAPVPTSQGAPAPPTPEAPKPRRPRAPAAPRTERPEPDAETLEELGRLFWRACMEHEGDAADAAAAVIGKLRAARRLGEIATLLGVE